MLPSGKTALLHAIYLGISQMRAANNGKRAVLIISDGGDINSRYNEINMATGHLLFSVGNPAEGLFLLEKGSVQTFRVWRDREIAIETLRPPAVFGETACFARGRHYFSAECLVGSQVRLISAGTIQALVECSPNLAHGMIGLISERVDRFLREFEAHASKGTIPRVAALLLKKKEEDVVCGLTHKDLAGELGIYRESVTAALGSITKGRHYRDRTKRKFVFFSP